MYVPLDGFFVGGYHELIIKPRFCTELLSILSIFPHSSMFRDSIETYNQFGCHFNFDGNICTRRSRSQKHMNMNRQKSCQSNLLVVSVLQELLGLPIPYRKKTSFSF